MHQLRPILIGVVSVLLVFVSYVAIDLLLLRRGLPPEQVRSFDAFFAWRPDANTFFLTDAKPPQLIAEGRTEGLVVSGPPAYVFNDRGELIDWTVETGEGGPVDELLSTARQFGKKLDRQRATDWVRQQNL